jgi:outer membrane protein TolC
VIGAPTAQALDLAACRQIALAQQPSLAAARASLSAAVARAQALDHLHIPGFLARDLPTRRKQAKLGITISQAQLTQAEGDTLHGVTFTYLAALYAAEQLQVADDALTNLKDLQANVKDFLKNASRTDIVPRHLDQIEAYILAAQGRREEAVQGVERALSGLREAMGVGPDYPLVLAGQRLPSVNPAVDKEAIVSCALARRAELVQATAAAQVTNYEICAQQALILLPTTRTFASGADLHAQPLPQGEHDEHYKPGAVGLEMPVSLTGSRSDRVGQAQAYNARAAAVVDKTRNLLVLEAEQAYLRWLEASRKVPKYKEATVAADRAFQDLRKNFRPDTTKVSVEVLLSAGILASQLRVQANLAYYQQLQGLAALERVTAGGFCAGLEQAGPPSAENQNSPKKENGIEKPR